VIPQCAIHVAHMRLQGCEEGTLLGWDEDGEDTRMAYPAGPAPMITLDKN